ncbi:unnamed protein product [Rhizoctonia solani]|uniref:Ribonuclease H1 N-terminal domain-containing protein n=1 Tax=Rhizoctonia solani TaxID=456999 RepID=A0A8H3BP21_9AGAM|nr:unnamed protein product [Rhizoctonia solani]
MPRDAQSPYPANAVFGVHKGFKTGVYTEYNEFRAQTEGFSGGKELWAVFTNRQHAEEYANTGKCPVRPLAQKEAPGIVPSSGLPTPDTSPETENAPSALPIRQRPATSAPLTGSVSQPPPAPRKPPTVQPEPDNDGDTDIEEEFQPASSSLPAPTTAKTPQNALPRRPYKSGSITQALKQHVSLNGGSIPGAQTPSPTKNVAPAAPGPVPPSTAPAASASGPNRQAHRGPSTASGSRSRTPRAPVSASAPVPAPAPVPTSAPALVPELPRQPRPHGTYEQCHHCDGKGWLFTPLQPPNVMPPPQPVVTQTPTRPRATPKTNLKILPTSDSDSASGSAASKTRTPSGSRLRVSSIGGVGPERTPKRDPRRVISDSVPVRRRIVPGGPKDKGKGRAVEDMDVDAPESEAGPSTYNYM